MTFTSYAFAQAGGGDMLATFLPIIAIMAIFYFLMIRPQQKKMKEHKAMVAALAKGDKVVTSSGFHGTVVKVEEADLTIEIAEGVKVKMIRDAVSQVVEKK
jgi:preprotein translocase subunit YajC